MSTAVLEPCNPYQLRIIDNNITGTRLWTWRIPEDRTDEAKRQVNLAHKMFLAGMMTLENYTTEAIKYLHGGGHSAGYGPDYDTALEDVQGFILTIIDSLEDKTFCPSRLFATKLTTEYSEYKNAQNCRRTEERYLEYIQSLRDAPGPTVGADGGDDNLESMLRSINKAVIEKAYANLIDPQAMRDWGRPLLESRLLTVVFHFAKKKIEKHIWDLPEAYSTADDFAQGVTLKVAEGLTNGTFKGTPANFYSWLHRIAYLFGVDAFREITAEFDGRVPLFVESEDGSGDMVDNPLLDAEQETHEHTREFPEFIQGINLLICKLIREGLTYEEIGIELGMQEGAVKMRVYEMRNKVEALDLPGKRAAYLAERDRLWAEAGRKS